MATKPTCDYCSKRTGIHDCRGCHQCFCTKCYKRHRESLVHELTQFSDETDAFKNRFFESKQNRFILKNLTSKIDDWEANIISRVEAVANRARKQAKTLVKQIEVDLSTRLDQLSNRIKDWRETENFLEIEIEYVQRELNKLNRDLDNMSTSDKLLYVSDNSERVDWDKIIFIQSKYSNLSGSMLFFFSFGHTSLIYVLFRYF